MTLGGNSQEMLKSVIDRIERLEEERKTLADDIKDIMQEAKGNGLDVKALRQVLRDRKKDAEELAAHEAIVETYKHALGMLLGTPLGESAMQRAGVAQNV